MNWCDNEVHHVKTHNVSTICQQIKVIYLAFYRIFRYKLLSTFSCHPPFSSLRTNACSAGKSAQKNQRNFYLHSSRVSTYKVVAVSGDSNIIDCVLAWLIDRSIRSRLLCLFLFCFSAIFHKRLAWCLVGRSTHLLYRNISMFNLPLSFGLQIKFRICCLWVIWLTVKIPIISYVKLSADDILKYFSYFFLEQRLWYFKCQSLFLRKIRKYQFVVCWICQ